MYRHKKCRYSCGLVPLLDLNTANIQTIFEKCKKKQLFYVVNEDI